MKRDQTLRIYLLYFVGVTLFTNKSANYMNVTYLKYFRDLELVSDHAFGAASSVGAPLGNGWAMSHPTKKIKFLYRGN